MRSIASSAPLVLDLSALELDDPGAVVVRHREGLALLEVDVDERLVRGDHQRVTRDLVRGELERDARPPDAGYASVDLEIGRASSRERVYGPV